MKNPFTRKTLAERRQATADKLTTTEAELQQAKADRLEIALRGEDTGASEQRSWQLAERVETFKAAIAQLDREIAEEATQAAEAERQAKRDEADTKLRRWRDQLAGLNLDALDNAVALLALHDRSGVGTVNDVRIASFASGNASTVRAFVRQGLDGFDLMLATIARGDSESDSVANRVLTVHSEIDPKIRRAA